MYCIHKFFCWVTSFNFIQLKAQPSCFISSFNFIQLVFSLTNFNNSTDSVTILLTNSNFYRLLYLTNFPNIGRAISFLQRCQDPFCTLLNILSSSNSSLCRWRILAKLYQTSTSVASTQVQCRAYVLIVIPLFEAVMLQDENICCNKDLCAIKCIN